MNINWNGQLLQHQTRSKMTDQIQDDRPYTHKHHERSSRNERCWWEKVDKPAQVVVLQQLQYPPLNDYIRNKRRVDRDNEPEREQWNEMNFMTCRLTCKLCQKPLKTTAIAPPPPIIEQPPMLQNLSALNFSPRYGQMECKSRIKHRSHALLWEKWASPFAQKMM